MAENDNYFYFYLSKVGFLFSQHGKNDFAEGSKILLNTDQKIILLNHRNNFVGTLKIISNAPKNFDILVIGFYIIILIIQQNSFSDLYPANFKSFNKIVLFVNIKTHNFDSTYQIFYLFVTLKEKEIKFTERIIVLKY